MGVYPLHSHRHTLILALKTDTARATAWLRLKAGATGRRVGYQMRRQNVFRENADSDLSISDDLDFDSYVPEKCDSLSQHSDRKEELQLPSRLEILRGDLEWDCGREPMGFSNKKETNVSLDDDDVEMPEFCNEGDVVCSQRKKFTGNSDEEMISDDDENNLLSKFSATSGTKYFNEDNPQSFGSGKHDEAHIWSAVTKQADALMLLNKNAPCSSSHSGYSTNRSYRDVRYKGKRKLSFRFPSNKEQISGDTASKDENDMSFKDHEASERLNTIGLRPEEHSISDVLGDCQRENDNQSEAMHAEVGALGQGCIEHSMAVLLDGLKDRATLQQGVSKMYSRTRGTQKQIVAKRSISLLGDRTDYNEDSPELMGSGSSSDDKAKDRKLKVTIPEMKRQTMTDRFQEAFGATFLNEGGALVSLPKSSGIGLFGKLQQLMQSEKERDMVFLKNLDSGASISDEGSCILVKILAKYLDAKLTVCQCSFGKNIESFTQSGSPQVMLNGGEKRTILFNPRISSDVDLEVGNLIRIHPPWKEIQVGNDENIVLSTYFSQILI